MQLVKHSGLNELFRFPDDTDDDTISAFFLAMDKPDEATKKVIAEGVVEGLDELKKLFIDGQNNSLALYKQTPEVMATMSKQNKESVREYQKSTLEAAGRVESSIKDLVAALSVKARKLKVKRVKGEIKELEVEWK